MSSPDLRGPGGQELVGREGQSALKTMHYHAEEDCFTFSTEDLL